MLTLSALHAIRGFRMPFALKGILLPFAISLKVIRHPFARCKNLFDYRMQYPFRGFFRFCMRYLIPFCTLQKGIGCLLDLKQKGASNPFKKCNTCVCVTWNSSLPLSENRRKILQIQKENVLVWIRSELRLQYCLRKPCKLQYRWDDINPNKKMYATFKNLLTIYEPYTHQGLSNLTTFSPI